MTHHTKDGHYFNVATGAGQHNKAREPSKYPGMPAGAALNSEWLMQELTFHEELDMFEDAINDAWTTTVTGSTPVATISDDVVPGHMIITLSGSDNDSWESQHTAAEGTGEAYSFNVTGQDIFYEIMLRFTDTNSDESTVEQVDWFVGFCNTDTTVIDGATDFIGFSHQDLDSDALSRITFVSADGGSTSGSLVDGHLSATNWTTLNDSAVVPDTQAGHRANRVLAADEWIRLAFYFDQGNSCAHVYVNGTYELTADLTDQIPDENLCLTVAVQNGVGVAKIVNIAYLRAGVRVDQI